MEAILVMCKADGTRRDFLLNKSKVLVGRTVACDVRILLPCVSRKHCEIVIENDEIEVQDLGSTNGTFVNTIRVQKTTLSAGDKLIIGPVVFTIRVNGEPAHIEPVRTLAEATNGETAMINKSEQVIVSDNDTGATQNRDDQFYDSEGIGTSIELNDSIAALEANAKDENAKSRDLP